LDRIFYECRDVSYPAGGVRRLYRHVEILNRHGFSAYVLHHLPGFKPAWFETDAPTVYWTEKLKLHRNDVLVIPEGHTDVIIRTTDAEYERVVIALSWSYIYSRLPVGRDWRHFGIRHVIAGSLYVQEFISRSMGLESTAIASGVDLTLFRPADHRKCQIAYMPRKNENWFHMIASIFRSQCEDLADVPFVPIDNASHREVGRVLSESAVFLATGFPEGLARPPLEAMASGCVVVGFSGRGSLEYMRHEDNCLLAEDMDPLTAAEHLGTALRRYRSGAAAEMQASALRTAAAYSLEAEERKVLQYWTRFFAERSKTRAAHSG
jgi:glycosyltransferase involved in cell wall biosynthesis